MFRRCRMDLRVAAGERVDVPDAQIRPGLTDDSTSESPCRELRQDFHGEGSNMSFSQSKCFGQPKTQALLPRQFRCSTVCRGTVQRQLERRIQEVTMKRLLQYDSLEMIEKHTVMLLKDVKFSRDLISQEREELFDLQSEVSMDLLKSDVCGCFGSITSDLKKLVKSNDETLKEMKSRLLAHFNDDDALLYHVKDILKRNKITLKKAAVITSGYSDYLHQIKIEIVWFNEVAPTVKEISELLLGFATSAAELESHISEQCRRIDVLSKEHSSDLYSQCTALNTFVRISSEIGVLSKEAVLLKKDAEGLCFRSKNLRTLLKEKATYATRFYHTVRHLKLESSKVLQEVSDLYREVLEASLSYAGKMNACSKVSAIHVEYKMVFGYAMSWRTRQFYGRNILPPLRKQGPGKCVFVSTVAIAESLNKRKKSVYSDHYRPDEFVIRLSEYHLQDIMRAFYASNGRKVSEKVEICLERLIDTGVLSEAAYEGTTAKAEDFPRYYISNFKKLDPSDIDEAIHLLEDAKVLVGTFAITTCYFKLGPDDVYDVPEGVELMTDTFGNIIGHAVVIVGYGMNLEGTHIMSSRTCMDPVGVMRGLVWLLAVVSKSFMQQTCKKPGHYVFQNWYEPTWGRQVVPVLRVYLDFLCGNCVSTILFTLFSVTRSIFFFFVSDAFLDIVWFMLR